MALAIDDTDEVVLFRGGRFVDWWLPANAEPLDVAYLKNGTLGVSLLDFDTHTYDRIVTYTPNGARSEGPLVDVYHLASTGTQFVSVENQIVLFQCSCAAHGDVCSRSNFQAQSAHHQSARNPPQRRPPFAERGWPASQSLTTGVTAVLQVPRAACPNPLSSSVPPASHPAGSLCEQIPSLVTSDGAGDLWMVLGDKSQIDVVEGFETT